MSPGRWYSGGSVSVFCVYSAGHLGVAGVSYNYGVRPVINLKADTITNSGIGTSSSPYVVG